MRLNAVGAPAGWLPLSRVHPVRPSWEEGQLHSSERSPHKRSGFIFGSNSCVPHMRGSPGVSGDISFPTDLFVLGHLYLSCRNSQNKCAVSQRCSCLVEVGNPASRHFSNANITSKALRHQEEASLTMVQPTFPILGWIPGFFLISTVVPNKLVQSSHFYLKFIRCLVTVHPLQRMMVDSFPDSSSSSVLTESKLESKARGSYLSPRGEPVAEPYSVVSTIQLCAAFSA